MSEMNAPSAFEFAHRAPARRTVGLISGMSGYRETVPGRFCQRMAAPLRVPLIISLGSPFRIAFGRDPTPSDQQRSFAAGLHAGPIHIESDGRAESVRVDFTLLGAYRIFGSAVADIAARMVDIGDLFGRDGRQLHERLGATPDWQSRFDLLEAFAQKHANRAPTPEIAFAYRRLALSSGGARITDLAEEIGWSRKHLVDRFRAELGLAPKPVARMIRFHHACRLAQSGMVQNWAGTAAESGYADQSHLAREFAAFAGESPTAWARRLARSDSRLTRPDDALAGW